MLYKKVTVFLVVLNIVLCVKNNRETEVQDPLTEESRIYHNHNAGNGAAHRNGYNYQDTAKNREGHSSKYRFSKGEHGKQGRTSNKRDYEEDTGHSENHHDEANNYNDHEQAGKTLKSAKFGEKEGHKRGHKTKGYHNKFFKDEYHREHKFYDNYHKKGHFKKNGDYNNKFRTNEGANKKADSSKSGYQHDVRGKKGHYDRGHYEDETKGRKLRQGHEQYRNANENFGRSKTYNGGNRYAYGRRH